MLKYYFDSGTTNSRLYVIDENGKVIYKSEKAVGSKDVSISGDKKLLARELSAMFFQARQSVENLRRTDGTCNGEEQIWMSGMITSSSGILEIPHIGVPVGKEKLAQSVVKFYEADFFKHDIYFIPGIKSVSDGTEITIENVAAINNMRGEETEIAGIVDSGIVDRDSVDSGSEVSVLIMPGSHTQIAVVQSGKIINIISTITGELFKALKSETILSASLEENASELDESLIQLGYKNLICYGFNRAIYITRSLQLFTKSTAGQRKSYLEGVINGGVLQAIKANLAGKVSENQKLNLFVCGNENQFKIIRSIVEKFYPEYKVSLIENNKEMPFSVMGFKAICAEYQALLKK